MLLCKSESVDSCLYQYLLTGDSFLLKTASLIVAKNKNPCIYYIYLNSPSGVEAVCKYSQSEKYFD